MNLTLLGRCTRFLSVLVVCVALVLPKGAAAAQISFIRDTEIENTIRQYADPIFRAAGLDPSAVRIYLVNDKQINAFVAGGQNLFINVGLIMVTTDPSEVIGVIAHECGHIAGGHLARVHDALRRGTAESILAVVLGLAAMAAGRPDVGGAVIAGGQNVAYRGVLQYSRTQEASADAAATKFLDATHQSAGGLLEFFEVLEKQESKTPTQQDPYLRTHPLTQDRIDVLREFVAHSPYSKVPTPPALIAMHQRMVAKLHAFLDSPEEGLRRFPANDTSVDARYGRAVVLHRLNRFDEALAIMDGLIAESPHDPYFQELKGQMLLEIGHPNDAIPYYRRAVETLPGAPLLRVDYARVEMATESPAYLNDAILNLRTSLLAEPNRPFTWRQLAIAYGRNGQLGDSALSLAEEAVLLGKKPEAKFQAEKAVQLLPPDSPGWYRAQDILQASLQDDE